MRVQCVFTPSNRYAPASFLAFFLRSSSVHNNYKTIFHNRELSPWLQCSLTTSNWYAPLNSRPSASVPRVFSANNNYKIKYHNREL
jgi:hypothetical protein